MVKFRYYADESKACAWLNEMAGKGYRLTDIYAGLYRFAPCKPGAYHYHMDFVDTSFRVPDRYRDRAAQNGMRVAGMLGQWACLEAPSDVPFADLCDERDACTQRITHMLVAYKAWAIFLALGCIGLAWCATVMPGHTFALAACVGAAIVAGVLFVVLGRRAFQVRDRWDEIRLEQGQAVAVRTRIPLSMPIGCFLIGVAGMVEGVLSAWLCNVFRLIGCILLFVGFWRCMRQRYR